jgi:multidrug efflux pump subunit AcrA (membrane-fusion protein)
MGKRWKIALLLLLLYACSGNKAEKEAIKNTAASTATHDDMPAEVKVKRLEYTNFNHELISNGTVAAVRKAELRFQSQEIIRKIYVKNGQFVEAGQAIAELDKFRLEMALKQAEESLERALIDLQDVLIMQGYALSDSLRIPPGVMKMAKIRSNYEQSRTTHAIAKYNLEAATLLYSLHKKYYEKYNMFIFVIRVVINKFMPMG